VTDVRFEAVLQDASGGGRWIVVPETVMVRFSSKRAPVRGSVNGVEFRSRVSVYGGVGYLGFTAEIRKAAGIEVGDRLEIDLVEDDEPRMVDVPTELAAALAGADDAADQFDRLSFTHRKEYARWVGEAKKQETRDRRAAKAIIMLREGIQTPD